MCTNDKPTNPHMPLYQVFSKLFEFVGLKIAPKSI